MSVNEPIESRILAERDFHNARFSEDNRSAQAKYYVAVKRGAEKYKATVLELAHQCDVLEYGCGIDAIAVAVSDVAKSITGIDISDVAVARLIARNAQEQRKNVEYRVMNAESLEFDDEKFDLIVGSGIIHHLHLERAFGEIARCLRKNGKAVFWEPLGHNLLINLYRRLTPSARTPDEHPLKMVDIQNARRFFRRVSFEPFGLTTLMIVPFRQSWLLKPLSAMTNTVDSVLLKLPAFGRQAWFGLLVFEK